MSRLGPITRRPLFYLEPHPPGRRLKLAANEALSLKPSASICSHEFSRPTLKILMWPAMNPGCREAHERAQKRELLSYIVTKP